MGKLIEHKGVKYTIPNPDEQPQIHWDDWHRPRIIAVDIDGTLVESGEWNGPDSFPKTNKDVLEAVKVLNKTKDIWIMIWTCRDRKKAAEKLTNRNIPFDSINCHPFEPEGIGRKPPYDALLDDRDVWQYNGDNADEFLIFVLQKLLKEVKMINDM